MLRECENAARRSLLLGTNQLLALSRSGPWYVNHVIGMFLYMLFASALIVLYHYWGLVSNAALDSTPVRAHD
jgi:hypothetical protein